MIVKDDRDTYAQNWTDYDQSEASGSSTPQPFSTEVLPAFANHVRTRSELRDSNIHHDCNQIQLNTYEQNLECFMVNFLKINMYVL